MLEIYYNMVPCFTRIKVLDFYLFLALFDVLLILINTPSTN